MLLAVLSYENRRETMPCLITNLDALEHNLALTHDLFRQWGVRYLPVLKMVAAHPVICQVLQAYGHKAVGMADIDEVSFFPAPDQAASVPTDTILINIPPLDRATDVVKRFRRSAVSSLAGLHALDKAACALGVRHDALLMLDIGDMREGVVASEAVTFAKSIRKQNFQHVRLVGVGATLGCLHGVCPDAENMSLLLQTALDVEVALGHSLEVISLGGSIFFEWFVQNGAVWPPECLEAKRSPGWVIEFRAGDPVLLGYDMYHDRPFPISGFRRDIFALSATVVEVGEKEETPCRHVCFTGQGQAPKSGYKGHRKRALLDCGRLHTDITELELQLPGAVVVDFSGNYTILDVTDCPQTLALGDTVMFYPRYWAVAKAFRMVTVRKQFAGRFVK